MSIDTCFATNSQVTLGKTSESPALFSSTQLKRDLKHLSNTSAHLVCTGRAKQQHTFFRNAVTVSRVCWAGKAPSKC